MIQSQFDSDYRNTIDGFLHGVHETGVRRLDGLGREREDFFASAFSEHFSGPEGNHDDTSQVTSRLP